jgi:tetratricopeptide (TPR) repeat protein
MAALLQAHASAPREAMPHAALAVTLRKTGRTAEAARHLDHAIQLVQPADTTALAPIAMECALTGRHAEAIRFFRLLLAANPGQPGVRLNLAASQLLAGQPQDSLASAQEVLRLQPRNPRAQFARAQALLALKRPAEALHALDSALRWQPDHLEYHSTRALALAAAGRAPEAVARLRALVRDNPAATGLLNNLAWLLASDSAAAVFDPAAAVETAARAAELSNRQDPRILHTLATAHAANAQPGLARAVCAEAEPLARQRGDLALAAQLLALQQTLEPPAP